MKLFLQSIINTFNPWDSFWVIGDLDGSIDQAYKFLTKIGAINSRCNWIGGDMTVVFLGDILWDRNKEWLQILKLIHKLRSQAEKVEWEIVVLAGNHDELAFWTLLWCSVNVSRHLLFWEMKLHEQSIWLQEFYAYGKNTAEIVQNMRLDKEARIFLEEMSKMKLIHFHEGNLFLHTPPAQIILSFLEKRIQNGWILEVEIANINTSWSHTLRYILFETPFVDHDFKDPIQAYDVLARTFLSVFNVGHESFKKRWGSKFSTLNKHIAPSFSRHDAHDSHPYLFLSQAWVSRIFHGHSGCAIQAPGIEMINLNRKSGVFSAGSEESQFLLNRVKQQFTKTIKNPVSGVSD